MMSLFASLVFSAIIASVHMATQPANPAPAAPADPLRAGLIARAPAAAAYSVSCGGQAVLVMHKGEIIFEQYDNGHKAEFPHVLASGTKSFTGVIAAAAVADGLITWDEAVCDTITEWKTDEKKSKITVRHLLGLSSGLNATDPRLAPVRRNGEIVADGSRMQMDTFKTAAAAAMTGTAGGQFVYGPTHFFAFGEFMNRKLAASGRAEKTLSEYMQKRYFDALGLSVRSIRADAAGNPNLPGGGFMTARQWAKFGDFILCDGAVRHAGGMREQIIPADVLAECFKPSACNKAYGLTWWLPANDAAAVRDADTGGAAGRRRLNQMLRPRRGEDTAPPAERVNGPDGKPVNVRMAAGAGNQRLYILPQWDLVVVRFAPLNGNAAGRDWNDLQFLRALLEDPAAAPQPAPTSK